MDLALPQIWVEDPADAERARAVIAEHFASVATGPSRRCPQCGEENPPAFELCWSCGVSLH